MSGYFNDNQQNSPNIKQLWSGSKELGWSYGLYDDAVNCDGNGNLTSFRDQRQFFYGIPLSTDLLTDDTIKICGMVQRDPTSEALTNETFYITVSYFTCTSLDEGPKLSTVIPVAAYPFSSSKIPNICFSESTVIQEPLFGCSTFLIVGMGVGNDDGGATKKYRFTYTLEGTQACVGSNLLIRLCCDPEYTVVISNNGLPIGTTFVDDSKAGYCWTIVSLTTADITDTRGVLDSSYTDCTDCIADNPCPENYEILSCCRAEPQVFTSALVGVNVGDTFVDTFGFCWSVISTSPLPITNVVAVGTVYTLTDCDSATCVDSNPCPIVIEITDCCNRLGYGYTTIDLLGITVGLGDVFVDTFGICWTVTDYDGPSHFPNLHFITGSTIYGPDDCQTCVGENICDIDLYYTVQNCCTEEIEVIFTHAVYGDGAVLHLQHSLGAGCYRVLSWSNTGTATLTSVHIYGVSIDCDSCIGDFLNHSCPGMIQHCENWYNFRYPDGGVITGYMCDGTWVSNYTTENICMSVVINTDVYYTTGSCCFTITNPSSTQYLDIRGKDCQGQGFNESIAPLGTTSYCISDLNHSSGPWTYTSSCT